MTTIATDASSPITADREDLRRVWSRPAGIIGWLGAVNHKIVAMRFIVTAFVFLLAGGVEALLIRMQLARAENDFVSPEAYNEIFTLHGSTMMFLFAVPILEGLAMYLVPLMIGTRDMPFPRLNAFGYWSYLFGGLFVYSSILAGDVPDGGWFAYVPLTGREFSPGDGLDFWLLGVTFVEVAGIVGAIELIVLIGKHRAPGMSLDKMPLFVWATLAMAFMMLFAFTTLATASVLLELERSLDWPFFDPGRGGEPLLWQHLFWIFGHPEVYIMLLPATGIVSTVIPTFARRTIVGYGYIVVSLVAIAFVSFGLWVHHMFAVGIPFLAMTFFTAASMMIAIPSGIQIFAWVATLWRGAVRWSTPLLFVLGFVFIFVAGGITGVMVAMVPFDWQAHDSFFVVAHFHYVLVGGVVFPVFAGLHYWWPKLTGHLPSEALGKWSFWLMFVGFNVAFFPQHILGLAGMPRRVATYEEGLGWDVLNLTSTIGAFVLAAGVLVFTVNLVRARLSGPIAPDDPWAAGSLEWATASPPEPYNFEHLPVVADRDPLWAPASPTGATATLQEQLRRPHGGRRETWSTSPVDAAPEEVVLITRPSLWPLVTATAITIALVGVLTGSSVVTAGGSLIVLLALLAWLWPSRAELHQDAIEAEHPLEPPAPTRRHGVWVAGRWGMMLAVVVGATALATLVFSYFRLLTTAPQWPPAGLARPGLLLPLLASTGAVVAAALTHWSARAERSGPPKRTGPALGLATAAVLGGLGVLSSYWSTLDVDPTETAFGAVTAILLAYAIVVLATVAVATLFVLAGFVMRERVEHPVVAVQTLGTLASFGAVTAIVTLGTIALVPRFV